MERWDFPGWGRAERITDLSREAGPLKPAKRPHARLGTWSATAICGNDITSSVLYVSALCAAQAGALAPVVLLLVGGVLYLYRRIYGEVGSALPLNGGSYTLLLNTTNKKVAAAAACLTLLSYIATAVISAYEASHYAINLYPGLPVIPATIGLLGVFALLNILGITESARVAVAIFVLHLLSLSALAVTGAFAVIRSPEILWANLGQPVLPRLGHSLFYGFAAGMLGISGFESSANFIEEQRPGVFPRTLKYMWLAVVIFNPLISLLSLGLLPLADIQALPPDLLARMAGISQGPGLRLLVSVDAVLVLSGAVLTSFVGVNGLIRRMSLDRCLPQGLLTENRWRGTTHWIALGFFALCTSILLVTGGRIDTLAGVYTLSFLSVMALFAGGNMLLKWTRARLPRSERAGWPTVTIALVAVLLGLAGNIMLDPRNLKVFALYFAVTLVGVGAMLLRVQVFYLVLFLSRWLVERAVSINQRIRDRLRGQIDQINSVSMVYFSKGDDPEILDKVARYVIANEHTKWLTVVHVYPPGGKVPPGLGADLAILDRRYPRLRIDFLAVQGEFGPELVARLSQRLRVPHNYMFIATPGDRFPHRIEELGGVRVII